CLRIHVHCLCLSAGCSIHARLFLLSPSSFSFKATAPPEIYPLSLHDALPIYYGPATAVDESSINAYLQAHPFDNSQAMEQINTQDRKSTRLNSSHVKISYAVFCLKKKKHTKQDTSRKADARQSRGASADSACR